MQSFATIINDYKSLTIVAKFSILDVCMSPGYVSARAKSLVTMNFHDPSCVLKEKVMQNIFSRFLREYFEELFSNSLSAVFKKRNISQNFTSTITRR